MTKRIQYIKWSGLIQVIAETPKKCENYYNWFIIIMRIYIYDLWMNILQIHIT